MRVSRARAGHFYARGPYLGLAPGEYVVRFAYVNYPDYSGRVYDVTTDRASRMWEGRIESAPVTLTIQPPDADRLATVLQILYSIEPGGPAIRAAGAFFANHVEPLLQLYLDDPNSRPLVALAIAATGDAAAAARLLDLLATHPHPFQLHSRRGPRARGDGAGLSSAHVAPRAAVPSALDARCPDLMATLHEMLLQPPPFDWPPPEVLARRGPSRRRGRVSGYPRRRGCCGGAFGRTAGA